MPSLEIFNFKLSISPSSKIALLTKFEFIFSILAWLSVIEISSELKIDTTNISPEQAVQEVMLYLEQKGFIK